jgi:transcriptional regulator with XRE-family HTH domain
VSAASVPFAQKLQALREKAGISQYELAKRAAISKQEISRLELGQREPRWATVQALAKALGVTCEEFGESVESTPSERAPRPHSPRKTEAEGGPQSPQPRRRRRT